MGKSTRGTHFYIAFPGEDGVTKVARLKCMSNLDYTAGTRAVKQGECLDDLKPNKKPEDAQEGSLSGTLQFDYDDPVHIEFINFAEDPDSENYPIAVGFPDGISEPTLGPDGEFILPLTRTWRAGRGFVSGNNMSAAVGADFTAPLTFVTNPGFKLFVRVEDVDP